MRVGDIVDIEDTVDDGSERPGLEQGEHLGREPLDRCDLLLDRTVPEGGADPVDPLGEDQPRRHRRRRTAEQTDLHDRPLRSHHPEVPIGLLTTDDVEDDIDSVGHRLAKRRGPVGR